MIRARFYANGADYRPVEWLIKNEDFSNEYVA